jgi:hypothetical protein
MGFNSVADNAKTKIYEGYNNIRFNSFSFFVFELPDRIGVIQQQGLSGACEVRKKSQQIIARRIIHGGVCFFSTRKRQQGY